MNNFHLGDTVYLITDLDTEPHMIISITTTLDGGKYYTLASNGKHIDCYELEISKTKNIE